MLRILLVAILIYLLLIPILWSEEIHHHHGETAEVDRFYSTWKMPNNGEPRFYGCCSRTDCYSVEAQFRGGHWWFKHRETGRWMIVPPGKVEHEQPDPKESPDGFNHVCASPSGAVYCFVAGLQT